MRVQEDQEAAATAEPEEVAQLTTSIAEKLREVAEMRQRLRQLRSDPSATGVGSTAAQGSVNFELTRTTSTRSTDRTASCRSVDGCAEPSGDESLCIICVDGQRNSVIL